MSEPVRRDVLPIPDRPYRGIKPYSSRDPAAKFPKIEPVRPPAGAPNVLLILIDDAGFGASSAFGGLIDTPAIDRLANGGLRYNRFHTTALCSPTRQAMLTGRNQHVVEMGGITEVAVAAPGGTSVLPNHCAPLAKTLRYNGYSTAQFGKCHEVPVWEVNPVGPFDRWPTGSGFEYFYGFLGGEADQYFPALYENTTAIEPPATPEEGYHLLADMTDRAISWIGQQKALAPDKPFFVYFAPGAMHAPHHVAKEWADKYKGRFDDGWDALREKIFARQKQIGVVPQNAVLTPRHPEIPAWDSVDAKFKPALARQMEVYAGFLEFTDHQIGRLIDILARGELLHDTLICLVVGDNGASAEGGIYGSLNETYFFNGAQDLDAPEIMAENIDKLGTPDAFNHYAVGWAHAMDTPYQWTKQIASHWGGTRNGCIVHWPNGIKAKGEIRSQFHHVIDVAPTVLEAAQIPEPLFVEGVQQTPIEGVSMAYSFSDEKAAERHTTQYFEMACNRAIYHEGWTAVAKHHTPWIAEAASDNVDDDVWELYNTLEDWTQAKDLAKEQPQKLKELQTLFLVELARHNGLPFETRRIELFNADFAGRPQVVRGNTQALLPGMKRLPENCVLNLKNKSHSVTADVEISSDRPGHGMLVKQGGRFGGWALYMKDGRPKYCYNFLGAQRWYAEGADIVPAGHHQIRMEFTYDGGGVGKGGRAVLYVDGVEAGGGRVERTAANSFPLDDGTDVGMVCGTMVPEDLGDRRAVFNGTIRFVELHAALDDQSHRVDPQELLRTVLARQ